MGYKDIIFEAAAKEQGLSWITVVENGETSTLSVCPASKTLDCYSVSKVFTVTALGLLCDDGMLSTEERVVDILRDSLPDGMDARWESVTVDDVIRHRWGIDHGFLDIDVENIEEYERLYGTRDDFLRIVLSAHLPLEVGSKYVYSDAAYYLLSRIITVKTGISLTELLRERLFTPMHFEETAWSCCPLGFAMGATGLFIRSADIAKLGQLYIDGGVYGGERYLSSEWCRTVLERGYELESVAPNVYAKGGMYGQIIMINTERRLSIAWLGYDTDGYSERLQALVREL